MNSTFILQGLYNVLHLHLASLFDGRSFPDIAPLETLTPFVVYGAATGGETNRRKRENGTLTLAVKCTANRMEDAFAGAMLISALLRDQGDQEGNTLPTDDEWRFTTVSQGEVVHEVDVWKDGRVFYSTGNLYTFTMERKTDG